MSMFRRVCILAVPALVANADGGTPAPSAPPTTPPPRKGDYHVKANTDGGKIQKIRCDDAGKLKQTSEGGEWVAYAEDTDCPPEETVVMQIGSHEYTITGKVGWPWPVHAAWIGSLVLLGGGALYFMSRGAATGDDDEDTEDIEMADDDDE